MQIILFRRSRLTTALCLGVAVAILWVVCHPAAIGAAGRQRALPIYRVAVPGEEKVAAITFDAAWGVVRMRQSGKVPDCRILFEIARIIGNFVICVKVRRQGVLNRGAQAGLNWGGFWLGL